MDQSNCDDLEQVSSTPNGIDVRRECSNSALNRDPVDTIRDTKDQKERQNVEIAISEQENVQQSHQNGSSSACFIDASSLLDENEIMGSVSELDPPQPIVPNPSAVDIPFSEIFPRRLSEKSASSSSSGSLNNLSDEEKLLKREKKNISDIKDQFNCDGVELRRKTFPAPVAGTPSLNDRRLAELERKQGELIFKNNIQHFSSHLMNSNNPSIDIYDTQPRKFSNSSEKSYFLPDTPHNSIVHVENSNSSNSLNSPKLFRKSKCDESSPIISGGINTKFESSSSSIDEIQRDLSSASSSKNSKSHNQSWVVDMSHSGPASARPRSSSTSGNESISSIERKSNMGGMGFYVSLHDMDTSPKSLDSTIPFSNFKKDKKSTEFYIDFSDTSREGTPKMARKKPSFLQKRSEEKELEETKPKEAEDVTLRKSLSSSVEKDDTKRHTWGSDSGDMKILDKISLISKVSNSSNSIDDSTYTKSVNLYGGATYDKHSSADSLTDALLSSSTKKSSSSTEETEDLTYQDENEDKSPAAKAPQHFSRFPGIMETIIESKESSSPSKTNQIKHHTLETLQATMEKQLQLLENGTENGCCTFVKLSDMDKPSSQTKFELHSPEMSKSTGNRQINRIFFDSRSNRPHSWAMTRSTGNNIMNITSSMDNLKSITRLFPHLSKELSNSLPNYIPFGNSPTPPYCIDLSMDSSSLTSSFSRSAMDESSMSCRQPRRLGEDLLKMFIQELATDVAIEVNGRLIKAHKCILRSRCQYFAAMLAGDWNDGNNALALPGFSYSSVHFALCHIYSGASHPPEGISLMELAALADLLGLEGLKEVTSHALKVNYCHNFHKPCSGCIDGILQVLPVALNHALDDLYRKCLKWACKYYMKVWPTRHFAQLPEDIFKRCRQQIVAYMTSESVLETILDCDSLLSQLATYRWALPVENLTRDILEAAYNYISEHFANVIASDYFLSLGHDKSKYIMHLENIILHTAATLCPDQACRSYQRITRLNAVLAAKVITFPSNPEELLNCVASGEMKHLHLKFDDIDKAQQDWHEDFIRLVSAILSAVEQCLIRQCSRAMRGMAWQRMEVDLRKKIQTLARLDPLEFRRTSAASSSSGGKPVAKAFSFGGSSSRTQNLIQVKLAMQASKKTIHTQTNDYENRVTNYNNTNTYHVGHGTTGKESASTRNLSTAVSKPKPKLSTIRKSQPVEEVKPPIKPRTKLSNVPPRYLEPKKLPPQPPEKKKSIVEKSNTMSLDSLASPRKKFDRTKTEPEKDVCTDSLGVSTKSSFISDHLTSQESLARGGVQRTTLAAQAKTVAHRKISNNSSSSSVTNRSSKFSSLNSMNSPSVAFQKRSISVPGTTSDKSSPSSVGSDSKRKSFLSARSREILAKRDERNKIQQQKQPQVVTVEVAKPTNNRNYSIGKSSSISNIPTRKNTNVLRNLNLRNSQLAANSKPNSPRTTTNKISSVARSDHTPEKPDPTAENPDIMSISKLERSSTFCMETSDLPVSELQIIE